MPRVPSDCLTFLLQEWFLRLSLVSSVSYSLLVLMPSVHFFKRISSSACSVWTFRFRSRRVSVLQPYCPSLFVCSFFTLPAQSPRLLFGSAVSSPSRFFLVPTFFLWLAIVFSFLEMIAEKFKKHCVSFRSFSSFPSSL